MRGVFIDALPRLSLQNRASVCCICAGNGLALVDGWAGRRRREWNAVDVGLPYLIDFVILTYILV